MSVQGELEMIQVPVAKADDDGDLRNASVRRYNAHIVTIAAMLGVKDEIELIGVSIAHLRSIGVDLIIAADAGSTDGTKEALDALAGRQDVCVMHVGPSPEERRAKQLAMARTMNADWVLSVDADEFWLPASGSLKDCRSLDESDVVVVNRFNVPPTRRGPFERGDLAPANYENIFLCVRKIPAFMMTIETHPDVPWLVGADIMPKVLARTRAIRAVGAGGHSVESATGESLRQATPNDLVIAHVPFSTFDRFERKVLNILERMRVHPEFFAGNAALHWQSWAALFRAGRLRQEFERQMLGDEHVARLIESGAITTAAALFAQPRD